MKPIPENVLDRTAGDGVVPWVRASESGRAPGCPRALDEFAGACGAFEWVTFIYLAWLNLMVLAFHRNLSHAAVYFAAHSWVFFGILSLAWAAAHTKSAALRFVRDWYPLPLYIGCFEELHWLVHIVFPGWFDRWLIAFDYSLAGVHPAVWLARFSSPAVNDFMQFSYMTYFLYLLILPAILYANQERLAFWTVMVSTAIAHYSVYVVALLFPVESPHYSLASLEMKPLVGGWFTAAINLIERFGRVHGAAFPSAHVAGSMVAILAARRYRPWLFWICLPFFVCMCVATVYGKYHYVADVLGGIGVGILGFEAGSWLMKQKGALPEITD
jgi:membrane-associated phospholipid phosphatase